MDERVDDLQRGPDEPHGAPDALAPADPAALTPTPGALAHRPGVYAVTPAEVAAEVGTAEAYREKAYAASTLRAYRSDWRDFVAYRAARGASPLPADPLVVVLSTCRVTRRGQPGGMPRVIERCYAAGRPATSRHVTTRVRMVARYTAARSR